MRTSRLRALRASAGSTTVQLPRSFRIGFAEAASRSISSSVSGSPCSASCQLKLNSASAPNSPSCNGSSRGPSDGARRSSTAEAVRSRPRLRGHITSTPRSASAPTPCSSRLTSSSVSRVISSGTRSPSSRSRTGQASAAARSAMLAWVRARDPNPWSVPVKQVDRVAHVQRVALVVDLQHEAYGARDQLLLVGLDPQRDPHQLGQVLVAHPLVARQLLLQPRREVHRPVAHLATGHRGGARHRVGDGVEDQQDQGLGRLRVVLAPRGREQPHPVGVVGVQRRHPPAPPGRIVGVELAARHQPQAEQRRSGQQPDRRVQVVARVRLGEHRQRRTDRQRDGAPLVAELHHALARRIGGPEGRRTGDGHEAQAADLGAGGAGLRT